MYKYILSALAALCFPIAANAGDLYAPASLKDPTPPPVIINNNWTGIYIGGFVGGSYDQQTIKEVTSVFTEDLVKGLSNTSILLGGYAGYDYEISTGGYTGYVPSGVVIGAWVDGAFADGGNSSLLNAIHFHENNTFAVGARVGYAVFPSFMPYVTGGFTMADYSVSFPGLMMTPFTGNLHNLQGGTIGGGVEFQVSSNVFAKFEYRHDMYDTKNIADFSSREFLDVLKDNLNSNRVMLGISYKLNNNTGGLVSTRYTPYK